MPVWKARIKRGWWSGRWHVYAEMSRPLWVASFMSQSLAEAFVTDVYDKRC